MQTYKNIKSRTEYFFDLTDEEVNELGWNEKTKLEFKLQDDGSVSIKPWVKVDLGEIADYPRDVLEMLVLESIEKDITINQVMNDLLKTALNRFNEEDTTSGSIDPNTTNTDTGLPGGQSSDAAIEKDILFRSDVE